MSSVDSDARMPPRPRRSWRGRVLRNLGLLAAVLAVLSVVGAVWESHAEAVDRAAYPPPGQLVDVGGHRLHLYCTGNGSPTVVIDAGLGDWSTTWALVQPEVSKTTTTCTYDRAGSGWSDPGHQPRTAGQFALELQTLLERAQVPGPYVLVGHSLGGLTMQVFAARYRSEVTGLVLIDSMSPGGRTRPASEVHTPVPLPFGTGLLARGLGQLGVVRLFAGPIGSRPKELSREAGDISVALGVVPVHTQAFLEEFLAAPESLAQAGEVRSLGMLPVTIVSRATKKSDTDWLAKQADLLRLSSNSRHVVSGSSGHSVHLERPDEVTAAIVDMVVGVR